MSKKLQVGQITANVNNFAPVNWDLLLAEKDVVFSITSDAARSITGLLAPPSSDPLVVHVVNAGGFAITLSNNSGSSAAANRFQFKADLVLAAGGGAVLLYDSAAPGWRCVATY